MHFATKAYLIFEGAVWEKKSQEQTKQFPQKLEQL